MTVGPTALSVNLNRVALLRNSREIGIPSVLNAARIALEAGADGITVHPRPDGRHIRASDVTELSKLLRKWPAAEFNIEGNPSHGLLEYVEQTHPHQCTFVPDEAGAATSDHGWDVPGQIDFLRPMIERAKAAGARVSLFMDASADAIPHAAAAGADRVELYTEPYARAFGTPMQSEMLGRYARVAEAALRAGLEVNAGHDLNRDNLPAFLTALPAVSEVSIGHALISDAIEFGLAQTVRMYQAVIRKTNVAARSR